MDPLVPLLPFMAENDFWINLHTGFPHWVINAIWVAIMLGNFMVSLEARTLTSSPYESTRASNRQKSTVSAWMGLAGLALLVLSYFFGVYVLITLFSVFVLVGVGYIMIKIIQSALGVY